MRYKKSLLILCLIIFLFSIAAVCSSDVNDTAIANRDDTAMELTDENLKTVEDNESAVSTEANGETLSDSVDNEFLSVENDLNVLGTDYSTYSELVDEIGYGGDIELQHDYYTYDYGGTIYIDYDGVIDGKGAVIDMAGSDIKIFQVFTRNVTLKNLVIINANSRDGAIWFSYSGTVINCNFTDNTATQGHGGSLWFGHIGTVINCNFINNTAATTEGGAIWFSYGGTIINCTFTGNNAATNGGAMYKGHAVNCTFIGNSARHGGAIERGSAENCTFIGNVARECGGAMNCSNAVNCNFTDNSAKYGGAIYGGSASDCTFTDNNASENGGALRGGSARDCTFIGNSAKNGGAIERGSAENCTFIGNEASDWGGAMNDCSNAVNCNFTGNSAKNGGAMRGGSASDCTFTDNNASENGGAMYGGSASDCTFNDNKVTSGHGGAIYFSSSGTVDNCNFTNNTAEHDGGAVYFNSSGTVTNCNFTNNKATNDESYGGAVFFYNEGTVTDCNFADNTAYYRAGAVYFYQTGTVENCDFVDNKAIGDYSYGGALYFWGDGTVENCNFINNTAGYFGGAVYFLYGGTVENCNFINNTVEYAGGAVCFNDEGTVTNCYFTGNNALTGSAIYFYYYSSTKTVSNSCFLNNRANAEDLVITKNKNNIIITFTGNDNLLNAIYSNGDVDFTNVTYLGVNGISNTGSSTITPSRFLGEAGQNITVGVIVNDNIVLDEVKVTETYGTILLDVTVDGNYTIVARHYADAYYTQKETILTNTQFYVNMTSMVTPKSVNITAKSNIKNEIIKGKLLFILPEGTEINANYNADGTWWALHTFDDFGEYNISASFIGLDGVIINDATLFVKLIDASLSADDVTLDVNGSATIYLTTSPAGLEVDYESANSSIATVDASGIVTGQNSGNTTITITIKADGIHVVNSTTINVTVNRINSSLIIDNVTMDYEESVNVTVMTEGAIGISAKINDNEVNVEGYSIPISGLDAGIYNLTVTTIPDTNHIAVNRTVTINVRKINSTVEIDDVTLNYGESTIITAITEGSNSITAKIDDNDVMVSNNVILIPSGLEAGNHPLTITTNPDANHYAVTKTVNITINKVDSNLDVSDFEFTFGAVGSTAVSFTGASGVVAEVVNQPSAIVSVEDETIIVSGLNPGNYNLAVTTIPDDNHNAVTKTVAIKVNKADSLLSLIYDVDAKEVVATLTNAKGKALVTANVVVSIDGVNYALKTNSKGQVKVSTANLTIGSYIASAFYKGNNKYNPSNASIVVKVKGDTSVSLVYDADANELVGTLTNAEGKALVTANVIVNLNGVDYALKTNSKGQVKVSTENLTYGKYPASISYKGNAKYNPSNASIVVNTKLNPCVTLDYNADASELVATLTTAEGKALVTANVIVSIDGVDYALKTNSKGKAKLSTADLTPGNYTASVTYKGNSKYNPASATEEIAVQ